MNKLSMSALMVSGMALCGNTFAWGHDGHQTVGYLAASMIVGTKAAKKVNSILKSGEDLATAAEWPDCAKGFQYCQNAPTPEMDQFANDNPAHHNYHYTDIPFQETEYKSDAVGSSLNDVVHALEDAIRVLQGKPVADPKHVFNKRDALFILAHMVGDIHQPLHVGAAYVDSQLKFENPASEAVAKATFTEGGNWLCVGSKGLHSLWDDDYVKRAMKAANADADENFAKALKADAVKVTKDSGDPVTWPAKWATETLKLSVSRLSPVIITGKRLQGSRGSCGKPPADAPKDANMWTVTLPPDYAAKAVDVVPEQLEKAGSRLAHLLMTIWP